jgi:hypothetical protein
MLEINKKLLYKIFLGFIIFVILLTSFIYMGNKIVTLKKINHEQSQTIIKKDLEIEILKIEKEELNRYLKEYEQNKLIDSVYQSIYENYEKY